MADHNEIKKDLVELCKKYSIQISTNEDEPQTDIVDKETGEVIFSFSLITEKEVFD